MLFPGFLMRETHDPRSVGGTMFPEALVSLDTSRQPLRMFLWLFMNQVAGARLKPITPGHCLMARKIS